MDNFVIVNECKELVHYVRSAGGAHFGELRYTLQQECDTRWNTMYNLLMSVHRVYDEVSHHKNAFVFRVESGSPTFQSRRSFESGGWRGRLLWVAYSQGFCRTSCLLTVGGDLG